MRVLCNLFGHQRNPRRLRASTEGWRAPCRFCGERLVRIGPKQWCLLSAVESQPNGLPDVSRPSVPSAPPGNSKSAGVDNAGSENEPEIPRHQPRRRADAAGTDYRNQRSVPDHDGQAQMVSIVLACCREIVRLTEHRPDQPTLPPASPAGDPSLLRDDAGRRDGNPD